MATRELDVSEEIRRLGQNFNEDVLKASYAIYKPLQERAPKDGVEVHKDIAYGPDERHRLDLFVPTKRPTTPAPVVVYFHGGGYVAGARSPLPGLIYDNVPTFFARHGLIGANATYRLAPKVKWPAGAEDVGRVVTWLHDSVARYGGDPNRIFIMGQSAGASHCATWAFMEKVHGAKGPGIKGVILLSGVYAAHHPDFHTSGAPSPNHLSYFGEDTSKYESMSPLGAIKPDHPATFISVTEFDPYPLSWPSFALAAALTKVDKRAPWFRVQRDHNHVSPAMQINSAVDDLGLELLEFIASTP